MMRLALAADLPVVSALTAAAYQPYTDAFGYRPIPVDENYAPRIGRGEVWLREIDGHIVGLAVVETHHDHLMLFSVAVSPEHQGAGHGTAILRWLEALAGERRSSEIRLYTNERMERNIALYTSFGFRETGRKVFEGPSKRVIVSMTKTLDV